VSRRRAIALIGLVAALGLPGCRGERPPQPREPAGSVREAPTPEQAAAARRTLAAWLECEECTDGELEAVLRLGPLATPTLAATLLGGPSPAARELQRRELLARHAELADYARSHPDARFETPADAWVAAQFATYLARYQVRSAQALAKLGGPDAERALAAALATPLRADVEAVVREAYESLDPRR
jgi:hypothetical protein